ncbi:hypothetical protein [Nocardia macrotermitis]|uniref:Uncharacterized protein n=1 Tax=Nocardia macrotermitis TaxID=2585198 RepID=A0A7K0DAW5_9NOCA|nr:hypothetical protein [Nocardia macrotermitis]MQY22926.1 hypothetical protein [Nocardia macrotermitis]
MGAGRDWWRAGVILGIVGVLIVVPAVLAALVPTRQTPVPPGATIRLSAPGQSPETIEFSGVDGWQQRTTGDRTTAVLDGPHGRILIATVVNGVTDFATAAQWRRKVLGAQTFPVREDGGKIANTYGFAGPTCRGATRPGVCAILGNHNLAVSVLISGTDSGADLQPIAYSLRVAS